MKLRKSAPLIQSNFARDVLTKDALALFTGEHAGHMGVWQYQKPSFKADPAGGAALWANFVRNANDYYLFQADVDLISASGTILKEALNGIKTVAEIGPGSNEAIRSKTLTLLEQASDACGYVAIDCDEETATFAAQTVQEESGRISTAMITDAFQLRMFNENKPVACIMLGSTCTNIQGHIGQPYHLRLTQMIQGFRAAMTSGDILVATFDTNIDPVSLGVAYNHPGHAAFGVSAIHLMARECDIRGSFDPHQWRYEPVISLVSRQVAHCVYPVRGQHFWLNGQEFKIQAGQHFVMNNSYKYDPADINRAMQAADFNVQIIQAPDNPMAMVIGRVC